MTKKELEEFEKLKIKSDLLDKYWTERLIDLLLKIQELENELKIIEQERFNYEQEIRELMEENKELDKRISDLIRQ